MQIWRPFNFGWTKSCRSVETQNLEQIMELFFKGSISLDGLFSHSFPLKSKLQMMMMMNRLHHQPRRHRRRRKAKRSCEGAATLKNREFLLKLALVQQQPKSQLHGLVKQCICLDTPSFAPKYNFFLNRALLPILFRLFSLHIFYIFPHVKNGFYLSNFG